MSHDPALYPPVVAEVLPYAAAHLLADAAAVTNPEERRLKVDAATQYARQKHPQFFKEETNETANH